MNALSPSVKIKIKILNPASGGAAYTSLQRALRFIRRGIARWEGDDLLMVAKAGLLKTTPVVVDGYNSTRGPFHWYRGLSGSDDNGVYAASAVMKAKRIDR